MPQTSPGSCLDQEFFEFNPAVGIPYMGGLQLESLHCDPSAGQEASELMSTSQLSARAAGMFPYQHGYWGVFSVSPLPWANTHIREGGNSVKATQRGMLVFYVVFLQSKWSQWESGASLVFALLPCSGQGNTWVVGVVKCQCSTSVCFMASQYLLYI